MAKKAAETKVDDGVVKEEGQENRVTPNSPEWTNYVLSLLDDDEKINNNPTTDGLRRIFEVAMKAVIVSSTSVVVQAPTPENEKRATVVHHIEYIPIESPLLPAPRIIASGAADVYWGNCDKVYRNHPVAVAETRAEGRALRRALKLHKVVAAEEITDTVEDDIDQGSVGKVSSSQVNFMNMLAERLNIDMIKLLEREKFDSQNVYNLLHSDAVGILRLLSQYQRDMSSIPLDILGYSAEWRSR